MEKLVKRHEEALAEYEAMGTPYELKEKIAIGESAITSAQNATMVYLRLSLECDKQEKRARIAELALENMINAYADGFDVKQMFKNAIAEAKEEIGGIDYEKQRL